ncbi:hypothetical protein A9Q83_01165 [Alphaproteobacteria bacterium 46_93_T64]|nr:hypothetical protein A9Q83_01165 [Alphaproteobacteria bacterium 46_93_T64]
MNQIQPLHKTNEFLFLRHGQTDWNLDGLLQGRSDRPLNASGLAQAHAAATQLASEGVDLIVTSPLKRAYQTAQVVSEKLRIPVQTDLNLIERNFGSLEGRLVSDIVPEGSTGLDIASSTSLPDDAEEWDQVCSRVLKTTNQWLSEFPAQKILIVSHYGVMSALCDQLFGAPKPAKNATPYRFTLRDMIWKMAEV